jgi:hypothetical protein
LSSSPSWKSGGTLGFFSITMSDVWIMESALVGGGTLSIFMHVTVGHPDQDVAMALLVEAAVAH